MPKARPVASRRRPAKSAIVTVHLPLMQSMQSAMTQAIKAAGTSTTAAHLTEARKHLRLAMKSAKVEPDAGG